MNAGEGRVIGRVHAHAVAGAVTIVCTADDARDLADALSLTYATDADLEATRPGWFDDVLTLLTAAVHADDQAGRTPTGHSIPHLRLAPSRHLSPVSSLCGEAGLETGHHPAADPPPSAAAPTPGSETDVPPSLVLLPGTPTPVPSDCLEEHA